MKDASAPADSESRELDTQYGVSEPKPLSIREAVELEAIAPAKRPLCAVFVTHGMGQQIPYETLDQIAEGLRQEDARKKKCEVKNLPNPVAADVEIGNQVGKTRERMQRIELQLGPDGEDGCDVHVYEGYWAPLTEGQVTLRNVMSFLLSAGSNGLINGSGEFRRWLFGQYRSFVTPVRIVYYLLIALAVSGSLVVLNTAIVTVAAARSPLVKAPWLTDGLIGDLSTVFNILLLIAGIFALSLWCSSRWKSRRLGILTSVLFVLALFAVIATAVAVPCLFYLHLKQGKVDSEILTQSRDAVFWLNVGIESLILLLAAVVVIRALVGLFRRSREKRRLQMAETGLGHTMSIAAMVAFFFILAGLLAEVVLFALKARTQPEIGTINTLFRGVSWPLLMALSMFVRNFLIQYAGDVAVYVTPHRLDRFNDLRHRIQDCVLNRARAVYEATVGGAPYDKVLIAGHSLGSVISYDVLNRLLSEDEAAKKRGDKPLGVRERTGLLLTFGSPLDKTAFLFAVQGQNKTDEAREAVAASVQPLIFDQELRRGFPWVNVYSPWDLFSGRLKFYDSPDDPSARVDNQIDEEAMTLIMAHTQYWRKDGLIFGVLYAHLAPRPAPPR